MANPTEKEIAEERLLKFFCYEHLPTELRAVSQPFCKLAQELVRLLDRNPERTLALRDLCSAKDNAVRAALP